MLRHPANPHRAVTRAGLAVAALAAAAAHAPAQEGGIEIFAGETLFEDGFRASVTEIYKRRSDLWRGSDTVPDPLDRRFEEWRTVLGLDYGARSDLTLSALVPFVHRELRSTGPSLRAFGLGDIALLVKRRIYRHEWKAGSFNWAVIGGLELPTGATDQTEGGARLPPGLQPGKGSWNPFIATSATYETGRARFDSTAFFKLNTEGAQQFEDGDFLSVDLSAAYRFLHFKYPGPTFGVRIGLQWRHEFRAEQDGATVFDSGADEVLLKTGLTVHPQPQIDLNLRVDVPVFQDYEGTQLGRDAIVSLSFGLRF